MTTICGKHTQINITVQVPVHFYKQYVVGMHFATGITIQYVVSTLRQILCCRYTFKNNMWYSTGTGRHFATVTTRCGKHTQTNITYVAGTLLQKRLRGGYRVPALLQIFLWQVQ